MSAVSARHITQLLYRSTPPLNFAHLVGGLGSICTQLGVADPKVTWDCDDIATLDLVGGRLMIGFSDALAGPFSACITVASSETDLADSAAAPPAGVAMLCEGILLKLEQSFPSDERRNPSLDSDLTPDLIDQLTDAMNLIAPENTVLPTEGGSGGDTADINSDLLNPDAGDMERLMYRLSSELSSRTSGLISRAIASATQMKGRTPQNDVLPNAVSAAADAKAKQKPAGSGQTAKRSGGMFWHAGKSDPIAVPPLAGDGRSNSPRTQGPGELQAVRDALYAQDPTQTTGIARMAAQAQRALQAVSILPVGLSNKIVTRQKPKTPGTTDSTKS